MNKVKPIQCPDKDNFLNIQTNIIAKLDDAKLACKSYGEKLGYRAFLNEKFIEGDVKKLANYFSEYLKDCPAGLHIWGGESSVQLPKSPGRGGRNQQLALFMAEKINNQNNIMFLSAGTDGTDGPTNDAGGIVDGKTVGVGKKSNLESRDFLNNADGLRLDQISAFENESITDAYVDIGNVYGYGHIEFYKHVVESIYKNKKSEFESDQAVKTVQLINAIYKSIELNRKPIEFNREP